VSTRSTCAEGNSTPSPRASCATHNTVTTATTSLKPPTTPEVRMRGRTRVKYDVNDVKGSSHV